MRLILSLLAASILLVGCGDGEGDATSGVARGFCEPPDISNVDLADLKGTGKISCAIARSVASEAIECQFRIGDCNRRGLSGATDATFVLNGARWDCGFRWDTLEPPPGEIPTLKAIECWSMERTGPKGEVAFKVKEYSILPLGDA